MDVGKSHWEHPLILYCSTPNMLQCCHRGWPRFKKIYPYAKNIFVHDPSVFQGDDQAGKYSQWSVDPGFPSGLVSASISIRVRCSQMPNIYYSAL